MSFFKKKKLLAEVEIEESDIIASLDLVGMFQNVLEYNNYSLKISFWGAQVFPFSLLLAFAYVLIHFDMHSDPMKKNYMFFR